jgi:DUF438 domain-containing protein
MEVFKYNEKRIKSIDAFMKKMIDSHTTIDKVEAYKEYEDIIESMTPIDLFYLHNYSDKTNLSIVDIKVTANKFINVFHKGLEKYSQEFNHPFLKYLNEESMKMEDHLIALKKYYKDNKVSLHQKDVLKGLKKCQDFEAKFLKFENIIFPNLEDKLPSTKPFEVLWSLHDDARQKLKMLISMMEKQKTNKDKALKEIGKYYSLIFGINQKEKLIIMPLLEELLTSEKLDKLFNEALEYGFVFIKSPKPLKLQSSESLKNLLYQSKTGNLTHKQLGLIFNHIPLDVTFVDKDDRVSYYNDRDERHFPRNPSVIGRLVKHCHPPKSVHVVEKIVEDFKSGLRDQAEFWIEIRGVFLYIVYYAIRDDDNIYQGVLEVSQDITKLRQLKGEKRLLDQ